MYVTDALTLGDGVKKERADLTVESNELLAHHLLQQNPTLNRKSKEHPEGNTHIVGLVCPHIDSEQLTMARNIQQTTSRTIPYCKVTYHFTVVCSRPILYCSRNKLVYVLSCSSDKCHFITFKQL